jgi:hypothetical protein
MLLGSRHCRDAVTSAVFVTRVILGALAVATLLVLQPIHSAYQFKSHYSAVRVSLKSEHHPYRAPSDPNAVPSAPRAVALRAVLPVVTHDRCVISSNAEAPVVPIALWLMRLKLCPPNAGAEATLI